MESYPPIIAALIDLSCRMPLGPGTPDHAGGGKLQGLSEKALFAPVTVHNADMARACLAGLWLRFNHLDESHRISQELEMPEGSFWHAMLHRREPDPGNSKYWWHRVGSHPIIWQLAEKSPALGYAYTDPFAFVDHCERVRGKGGTVETMAEAVQELEWRLLFDWCCRKAEKGSV